MDNFSYILDPNRIVAWKFLAQFIILNLILPKRLRLHRGGDGAGRDELFRRFYFQRRSRRSATPTTSAHAR